jgi:hypothetical protein
MTLLLILLLLLLLLLDIVLLGKGRIVRWISEEISSREEEDATINHRHCGDCVACCWCCCLSIILVGCFVTVEYW